MERPIIVWLRRDLRFDDNPALAAAAATGSPVVPVFIWAPQEEAPWSAGGASRVWLHDSLAALQQRLAEAGMRLVLRRGETLAQLRSLAAESGAGAVFWNRLVEPNTLSRDAAVKSGLRADGLEAESFCANLLWEPWEVKNQSGAPFRVFTPFWKHVQAKGDPAPAVEAPPTLLAPKEWPRSTALEELELLPRGVWARSIRATWVAGEVAARRSLDEFLAGPVGGYPAGRDIPAESGTSRLSPYVHVGAIGVRRVWQSCRAAMRRGEGDAGRSAAILQFLREVAWRDFAHHLLFHFPHTTEAPLREEFGKFPWKRDEVVLRAWQRGRTGYPIVDAGMRELWETGWMHNRVRMIAGSFLVKDLLLSWREGAAWFWDTLVDADLANNTFGWQWTAGCGADAAPYFRIFNPTLQGEKFDPRGEYVRRWVPELAGVPAKWIHRPWEATRETLASAGVVPGESYPKPIVAHGIARDAALAAYSRIKKQ